jgi:hypothetical protein
VAARGLSNDSLSDLARRASFVFQGRIEALGEHNLDGVETDERMALVRVDDVVVAPPLLGDLTGTIVTVYLTSRRGVKNDQELTFFATSWHYGATLGVVEIGRTGSSAAELRDQVIEERLDEQHRLLEVRIRRAQLIISGQVLSTSRSRRGDLPGIDEGVEWWESEMFVRTVEKGIPPKELIIFHPVGGDREWSSVPQNHPGQVGVWLLGPVSEPDREPEEPSPEDKDKAPADRPLMALDPLDYQAISALPHLHELLRRIDSQ